MDRCPDIFRIILLLSLSATAYTGGIRQRSDGCGPHPLIALVSASRPYGGSGANLNEILRILRADPDIWSEMQGLLRIYDDCIRAGDGLHYKRSEDSGGIGGEEEIPPVSQSKRSFLPILYGRNPAPTVF